MLTLWTHVRTFDSDLFKFLSRYMFIPHIVSKCFDRRMLSYSFTDNVRKEPLVIR